MLLLALLEDERKSFAIWYILFRQSPMAIAHEGPALVEIIADPELI